MEFDLEGAEGITVEGDVEMELPDYVVMLPREELEEAKRAAQRNQMVLAVGRHPASGDIVLLTGGGTLMELSKGHDGIPDGPVMPIDFGHTVAIDTGKGYYEMAADWVIHNARTIIKPT
jgi:hypothetical protein